MVSPTALGRRIRALEREHHRLALLRSLKVEDEKTPLIESNGA